MKSVFHSFKALIINYFRYYSIFLLFIFILLFLYSLLQSFSYSPVSLLDLNAQFIYTYPYSILDYSFFITYYLDFMLFLKKVPFFIYFFILFFFTTLFSFLSLNYLGLYGVFFLNILPLAAAWLTLLFYFKFVFQENIIYYINGGSWISLNNNYKVDFEFLVDSTSFSFILLTTSIAVFVYVYAFSYFRYEPLVERLLLFLNSFILSMVFLVSSGNTIMFFLGWELIGLTSFFLINFWSTKVATLKCAFKAYSFNKVSDCLLLFSFILLFMMFNTTDLLTINSQAYMYASYEIDFFIFTLSYIEIISIFLLGAAFIKSAQFGAHIWLPDSMEAPVPASALIHSATLVSAGIFILLRFSTFFENSSFLLAVIFLIGSFTAFYGGVVAAFQTDCKKLLAYSTISHCGFLMVLYSSLCFEYVVLYLYIHGFFKASTFLSVGNILRFARLQDYRRMGLFNKYLPFDSYAVLVGLINLAGLPFSFGFFIKHLLFVSLNINLFLYFCGLFFCIIGALSGLFYSYRLYYYVFYDFKKSRKATYVHVTNTVFNSIYYSNSGVAATLAITCLIVVAYFISFFLFTIYLPSSSYYSDFFSYKYYNTQLETINELYNYTKNYQILNIIVISLALILMYTSWRYLPFRQYFFISLFFIFCVMFYFIFFYKILDIQILAMIGNYIIYFFNFCSTFVNNFNLIILNIIELVYSIFSSIHVYNMSLVNMYYIFLVTFVTLAFYIILFYTIFYKFYNNIIALILFTVFILSPSFFSIASFYLPYIYYILFYFMFYYLYLYMSVRYLEDSRPLKKTSHYKHIFIYVYNKIIKKIK